MEKRNYLVRESTWGSPSMRGTCVYFHEFSTRQSAYDYAEKQEKWYIQDEEEHPDHSWEIMVYSPDEWEYDEDGEYLILK